MDIWQVMKVFLVRFFRHFWGGVGGMGEALLKETPCTKRVSSFSLARSLERTPPKSQAKRLNNAHDMFKALNVFVKDCSLFGIQNVFIVFGRFGL